jgi:hypothetical protein
VYHESDASEVEDIDKEEIEYQRNDKNTSLLHLRLMIRSIFK